MTEPKDIKGLAKQKAACEVNKLIDCKAEFINNHEDKIGITHLDILFIYPYNDVTIGELREVRSTLKSLGYGMNVEIINNGIRLKVLYSYDVRKRLS